MGCTRCLFIALFVTAIGHAAEWDATFAGGKATTMVYNPRADGLKIGEDVSSYLYRFIIPDSSDNATVGILPVDKGGKATGDLEKYEAVILQRSQEMIVLKVKLLLNGKQIDRFQIYTVFPKIGVGFCTTVSAYIIGSEEAKALAVTNFKIPPASTNTDFFIRVD